jgi:type II secretory pathway pseudopilin PulG
MPINPNIKKRQFASLIEILIVFAIVISMGSIFGISIYKARQEQRFNSEVELVLNKLKLAQDLMLIFKGEVTLKLTKHQDNKAALQLEFDVKLPSPWKEKLSQPSQELRTIKGFHFEDQHPLKKDLSTDEISVYFYSNGDSMSRGLIRLTDTQSEANANAIRYIYLPGHPAPLTSSYTRPVIEKIEKEMKEDKELSQRVKEEIDEV